MPHAGRHEESEAVLDVLLEVELLLGLAHLHLAFAGVQTDELVGVRVHLEANVPTDRYGHQCQN